MSYSRDQESGTRQNRKSLPSLSQQHRIYIAIPNRLFLPHPLRSPTDCRESTHLGNQNKNLTTWQHPQRVRETARSDIVSPLSRPVPSQTAPACGRATLALPNNLRRIRPWRPRYSHGTPTLHPLSREGWDPCWDPWEEGPCRGSSGRSHRRRDPGRWSRRRCRSASCGGPRASSSS